MFVYVFDKLFFNKVNLPIKINGVYPLYLNDRVFLGNIEEQNGNWNLILADNITQIDNNPISITPFSHFTLTNEERDREYNVFILPIYDENLEVYKFSGETLSIGPNSCDINYEHKLFKDNPVTLTYKENNWTFETENENIFVSGYRQNKGKLLNGDYVMIILLLIIQIIM